MTGFTVSVSLDDVAALRGISGIDIALRDLRPAFDAAGVVIVDHARRRFIDQQDPDGRPWAALSASYLEVRRNKEAPILTQAGHLRDSLTHMAGRHQVEVGSNKVQAAIHQFGGTDAMPAGPAAVPARPFLPTDSLPAEDAEDIGDIFARHLGRDLP